MKRNQNLSAAKKKMLASLDRVQNNYFLKAEYLGQYAGSLEVDHVEPKKSKPEPVAVAGSPVMAVADSQSVLYRYVHSEAAKKFASRPKVHLLIQPDRCPYSTATRTAASSQSRTYW